MGIVADMLCIGSDVVPGVEVNTDLWLKGGMDSKFLTYLSLHITNVKMQ